MEIGVRVIIEKTEKVIFTLPCINVRKGVISSCQQVAENLE
jgi:hypothetical protein